MLLIGWLGTGVASAQPTPQPAAPPAAGTAAPSAPSKANPEIPVVQPQPATTIQAPQPKPGTAAPALPPKTTAAPKPRPSSTTAADVALVPGPGTVPVTGVFTLGFRLRGGPLEKYSEFPELEGFKKIGKTSTTTTRIVQGRRFTTLTILQRYLPYGEGEYVIKPFQLNVNGVLVRSRGGTVRVTPAPTVAGQPATPPAAAPGTQPAAAPAAEPGAPVAANPPASTPATPPANPAVPPPVTPQPNPAALTKPANPTAPLQAVGDLDKLFGRPKPALYQELPDRAFLAVTADRASVFVGEGVRVGLYFYLTPADQAMLGFYDFEAQAPAPDSAAAPSHGVAGARP
ncbi:hypothetical protein ACFQT0_06670 [Hymenobacter humi]|uniref:DUF4138 domain-containing protein n=1 Tax=Hymenobacter humi TaxID=1411620 RepID=A0ABW2U3S8_9BACT